MGLSSVRIIITPAHSSGGAPRWLFGAFSRANDGDAGARPFDRVKFSCFSFELMPLVFTHAECLPILVRSRELRVRVSLLTCIARILLYTRQCTPFATVFGMRVRDALMWTPELLSCISTSWCSSSSTRFAVSSLSSSTAVLMDVDE